MVFDKQPKEYGKTNKLKRHILTTITILKKSSPAIEILDSIG